MPVYLPTRPVVKWIEYSDYKWTEFIVNKAKIELEAQLQRTVDINEEAMEDYLISNYKGYAQRIV